MGIKSDDEAQVNLFDVPRKGFELWQDMPEFESRNLEPFQTVQVRLRNAEDRAAFAKLIGQDINEKTFAVWYPKMERRVLANLRYASKTHAEPKYPIYIISKGRWETRLTSKALEAMNVPYRIVIEPQEYDQYAEVIDPSKILVLPFSNLGLGGIPARNWVWEHSISEGHERHWILDDNIRGFARVHEGKQIRVGDGVCFRLVEEFVEKYENVPIAGLNYAMFAPQNQKFPPYYLNTRVYSCILIQNNVMVPEPHPDDPLRTTGNMVPLRWRGRYNEDTDLSLRALKAGYCTYLLTTFCCEKIATMTMKGGNTESLYLLDNVDGRLLMAQHLVDQHPDVTTITEKWGRYQHQVNYKPFAGNKLIPKPGVEIQAGVNNYGIELVEIDLPPKAPGAKKGAKSPQAVAAPRNVVEVDLDDLEPGEAYSDPEPQGDEGYVMDPEEGQDD